ncbi:hypothetical protein MES5069_360117 [Mesorhizobium escarrei]|uniref:Transposase n=1 Tax=Mesorhizobium escarrei TaxID=666018 RepID=A0ABM9E2W2_9HYPH|nr:hypothetical protein MES5069_360117 [Mesorhizobium escarrei]
MAKYKITLSRLLIVAKQRLGALTNRMREHCTFQLMSYLLLRVSLSHKELL